MEKCGDAKEDESKRRAMEDARAALQSKKAELDLLANTCDFIKALETSVPVVAQLLGSKSTTDVSECIAFFVTAHEFRLTNALTGIKAMLVLVWSREQPIKEK